MGSFTWIPFSPTWRWDLKYSANLSTASSWSRCTLRFSGPCSWRPSSAGWHDNPFPVGAPPSREPGHTIHTEWFHYSRNRKMCGPFASTITNMLMLAARVDAFCFRGGCQVMDRNNQRKVYPLQLMHQFFIRNWRLLHI